MLRVDDSEPLDSQVLAIYLYSGNISVELTSSDNIANNFAEEWRFFINWSAVSEVKQKLIAWKTTKGPIPNHAFINPKKEEVSQIRCNSDFRPKTLPKSSKTGSICVIKTSVGRHSRPTCQPTGDQHVGRELVDMSADTHVGRHPLILHRHSANTLPTLGQQYTHFVSSWYWVLSSLLNC